MGLVNQPVYSGVAIGEGSRRCVSVEGRMIIREGAGDMEDSNRCNISCLDLRAPAAPRHNTLAYTYTVSVDTLHSGRVERRGYSSSSRIARPLSRFNSITLTGIDTAAMCVLTYRRREEKERVRRERFRQIHSEGGGEVQRSKSRLSSTLSLRVTRGA